MGIINFRHRVVFKQRTRLAIIAIVVDYAHKKQQQKAACLSGIEAALVLQGRACFLACLLHGKIENKHNNLWLLKPHFVKLPTQHQWVGPQLSLWSSLANTKYILSIYFSDLPKGPFQGGRKQIFYGGR